MLTKAAIIVRFALESRMNHGIGVDPATGSISLDLFSPVYHNRKPIIVADQIAPAIERARFGPRIKRGFVRSIVKSAHL